MCVCVVSVTMCMSNEYIYIYAMTMITQICYMITYNIEIDDDFSTI